MGQQCCYDSSGTQGGQRGEEGEIVSTGNAHPMVKADKASRPDLDASFHSVQQEKIDRTPKVTVDSFVAGLKEQIEKQDKEFAQFQGVNPHITQQVHRQQEEEKYENVQVDDKNEENMLSGKIVLNGEIVLAKGETMAWMKQDFVERIQNLGRITSIQMRDITCSQESTITELIESLSEQSQAGDLKSLELTNFLEGVDIDLQDSVFEPLIYMAASDEQFEKLYVICKGTQNDSVKEALIQLIDAISGSTSLSNLDLVMPSNTPVDTKRVLLALQRSSQNDKIKKLELIANKESWELNENQLLIRKLLEKQQELTNLVLSKNYFNSKATARIISALNFAPCVKKIVNLQFEHFNWDSNDSCINLSNLVAQAENLIQVTISGNQGKRQIMLERTAGDTVQVKDKTSRTTISEVQTQCIHQMAIEQ